MSKPKNHPIIPLLPSAPSTPIRIPPVRLNVDTDTWVTTLPRVAGVERGTLTNNEWLDCTFEIRPAIEPTRGHQRGFAWTATFKVKDGIERATFDGTADSRRIAFHTVIDVLTKKIRAVADERKAYLARTEKVLVESVKAGVATADGFMHQP